MENRKLQGRTTESRTESTPKTKRESWFIRKGKNLLLAAGLATGLAFGIAGCSDNAKAQVDAGVQCSFVPNFVTLLTECLPADKCETMTLTDACGAIVSNQCVPKLQSDAGAGQDAKADLDGGSQAMVSANFRNIFEGGYKFNTDMNLAANNQMSVVSGSAISGNPDDLQSEDVVSSGTTIAVKQAVDAKWAVSSLDVLSMFPPCGTISGYCPCMIDYSSISTNQNVNWVSSATFNDQKLNGQTNAYSQNTADYDALGPFVTESVAYANISSNTQIFYGKEGGVAVVCKGSMVVKVNGSAVGTIELPSDAPQNVVLSASGSYVISTELSGAECFGVVVKHPLNYGDSTWF